MPTSWASTRLPVLSRGPKGVAGESKGGSVKLHPSFFVLQFVAPVRFLKAEGPPPGRLSGTRAWSTPITSCADLYAHEVLV